MAKFLLRYSDPLINFEEEILTPSLEDFYNKIRAYTHKISNIKVPMTMDFYKSSK